MFETVLRNMKTRSLWHLVWLSVVFSEAGTAIMSLLLRGQMASDYLITGGVVSLLISTLAVYLIKHIGNAEAQAANFSKTVFNSMKDAISVIDVKDFRILSCNDIFLKEFGLTQEEVIGKTCYELTHRRSAPCLPPDETCPSCETLKTGEYASAEHVHYAKDGTIKYVKVSTSPIKDKDGKVVEVVHVSSDITEVKQLQQELKQLAETDSLTGTYNRMKYEEIIRQELDKSGRYGRPLSLIMFDIDHFKDVNDKYGHAVGDQVLKGVADIAKAHKRKVDSLFRWGGEEFMIVASETDLERATNLAERIRKAIEDAPHNKVGKLTVSFGVTQYAAGDTDDSLLIRTDAALYKAKMNGRNRVETALA